MGPHWWNRKISSLPSPRHASSTPLLVTYGKRIGVMTLLLFWSAPVNSVICLHDYLFIRRCTIALLMSSQGNILSMKTGYFPLVFFVVLTIFQYQTEASVVQCQLKLYICWKRSVSDPSGYWLVQWSEARGEYYCYYYIVCVLFSEKHLVVPLDGAVVFRKCCYFKPVRLLERFSSDHHHTRCLNEYRSRRLLSMKYYGAKGRMSRADPLLGKTLSV